MKLNAYKIFAFFTITIFAGILFSCEDKINPTLEKADPILVVDAWINNLAGEQTIALSLTQPYLENVLPTGVSGASITVTDNQGKIYSFKESDKTAGNYVWKPSGNEVFGKIGNSYSLTVKYKNETFQAVSKMGRVPVIDSITFETEKETGGTKMITRGDFWATDPEGVGDTYWIKSFKNGVLLNKPTELNFAYDAGFDPGGKADGVVFIPPVRRRINSVDADETPGGTGNLSPFSDGDSVNVQIHSITYASFTYLDEVELQTNRPGGFSELFSRPLSNVSTNITNVNPNGSKAVGFFNVAAVSSLGKRYKKK
jgi:hypothetical protein